VHHKKLYDFNHLPENWKVKDYTPGSQRQGPPTLHEWGGGWTCRLLLAAYTISLLHLLCFNEVLKIQVHDLEVITATCIKLTLPFLKTSQFGSQSSPFPSNNSHINRDLLKIQPFFLYALPEHEAHLCPVRALANWLLVSRVTTGYIFQKIASGDWVAEANTPMVSSDIPDETHHTDSKDKTTEQFLEMFHNNLLDVGIDPIHMEHIPSDVVDVSICYVTTGGCCDKFVSGMDGALSSHIWQLSNIWSHGMMIQWNREKTFSTQNVHLLWSVLFVAHHALVHSTHRPHYHILSQCMTCS